MFLNRGHYQSFEGDFVLAVDLKCLEYLTMISREFCQFSFTLLEVLSYIFLSFKYNMSDTKVDK